MQSRLLHPFDLFKRPFYLHFNSFEKNSSCLGFIFSLGIYTLIILQFVKSDIFHYENPKVIDQPITEPFRRTLNFSNRVFTVSIVDDNSLAFADPSYFRIAAKNVYYSSNDAGGFTIDKTEEKSMHLCTENDFPDDKSVFDSLGLKNSYCLDENFFMMYGYWDEPTIALFTFQVYECDGTDPGVVCKSKEEIKNFFWMKYFNLVFADLKVDVENYTMPVALKYTNEYKLVEPRLNKMMNVFMKDVEVQTEDGLIFSHLTEIKDIGFDFSEVDFSFLQGNVDLNKSAPIFTCDFYSSRSVQKISRLYTSISEVFSSMGGLLSFLMIWGFLLTYIQNTFNLTVQIMNRLYSFQPESILVKQPTKEQEANKPLLLSQSQTKNFTIEDSVPNPNPLKNPPMLFSEEQILDKSTTRRDERANTKKKVPSINIPLQNSVITLDFALQNKTPAFKQSSPIKIGEEPLITNKSSPGKSSPGKSCLRKSSLEKRGLYKKAQTVNEFELMKTWSEIEQESKIMKESEKTEKAMKKSELTEKKEKNPEKIKKSQSLNRPRSLSNISFMKKKANVINDFKKFQTLNNNNLQVSIWEYFKFKLKKVCRCCRKGFKEDLFNKAEGVYEKEIDIVNILQRLQEIEKLKLVLLDEKQVALFNLLAKPMLYIERKGTQTSQAGGGLYMSEMLSATVKKENLMAALQYYEKLAEKGGNDVDLRLCKLLDQNIKEFKKYFEEI